VKQSIKVAVKGYYKYLHIYTYQDRVYVAFQYNKTLLDEVKSMRGARWHPNAEDVPGAVRVTLSVTKCWSVDLCERNLINFKILSGEDVFKFYTEPYSLICPEERTVLDGRVLAPYPHQVDMTSHQLAYRCVITAAEMGTGKTLAAIKTMERVNNPTCQDFWYISTRSGLMATMYELKFWRSKVAPTLLTYEELVRLIKNNPKIRVPKLIIFDESAAIKNITAQRTQAALFISDRMRRECDEPYIIEMSGAPQPQSPVDWWSQAEVAAPGFIREGDPIRFERRLTFTEPGHNNAYLKRVSWRDDPNKCTECGHYRDDHPSDHKWKPSKNEVEILGRRLRGLVMPIRKADVLKWLPEKIYRTIEVTPSPTTLRAAKLIASKSIAMIQKLTLLRMLSDGFKYEEGTSGQQKLCPSCLGTGTIEDYSPEADDIIEVTCPQCKGQNTVDILTRVTKYNACPKDDAFKELLEECEDHGRIVTYAGFTGSVDRCVEVALAESWDVIRVDGRRWHAFGPNKGLFRNNNYLEQFQANRKDLPKLAFIAQGGSAGTGLNLTAAEMIVYYSNDFNANNRIQSEDRTHRPGSTGAIIVDLIHLPTDRLVLDALKRKRAMQTLVLDASIFDG